MIDNANHQRLLQLFALLPNPKFNRVDIHFEADGAVAVSLRGPIFETGEMMPAVAIRLLEMDKAHAKT